MNECAELVKSLNQGEKKLISQHLNYEQKYQLSNAFQLLNQGGSLYDISEQLGKSKQQSSLLLHQLKENILNRLTHSKRLNPIEIELRNAINEIEFLKGRFLYHQALRRIKTLKPRLLEHERFNYLQEILLIEVEIDSFLLSERDFKERLKYIMIEYNDYQTKIKVFYHHKVQFYRNLSGIYDGSNQITIKDQFEMDPNDNQSGYYFYLRSALIQSITNRDFNKAESNARLLIKLIEDTPHEFDKAPFQRLDVYYMSALSSLLVNNIKDFESLRTKLINTPISHNSLSSKLQERILYLEWVGLSTKKLDPIIVNSALNRFTEVRNKISIEYDLRILEQIANYYIVCKKFREAKKWNYEILNKPSKKQRSQFSSRARIRGIYIAKVSGDYDFMFTLIDRVVSTKNVDKMYSSELINTLKLINENPDSEGESLFAHVHFLYPSKSV